MSAAVIIYLVVTATLGAVAMLKTSHWLRRLLKRQKALLTSRGKMQAIPTDSPLRNPARAAKERGLESLESQFTVTRRVQ